MLPRRTFRIRITLPVALLVGILSCAVNVWAQGVPPRPYSKEAIVGLLKGEVSPKRIAVLARQRGIDFQITSKVESELRRAGATAELLATLREVALQQGLTVGDRPYQIRDAPARPGHAASSSQSTDGRLAYHDSGLRNHSWVTTTVNLTTTLVRQSANIPKRMPAARKQAEAAQKEVLRSTQATKDARNLLDEQGGAAWRARAESAEGAG